MKFPAKFSLALQILCTCYKYSDKKITSNFIAAHTGADSSTIRHTISDLKKKNYLDSKPGPGGTTLSCDLSSVSLFNVYECVADINDSLLKYPSLPDSASTVDIAIWESNEKIFKRIKNDYFEILKQTTVLDICKNIQNINPESPNEVSKS